jgi:hypothetical protein
MIMISKYRGIPTTRQGGDEQFKDVVHEYKNHSFFSLGKEAFVVLKKVEQGLYKGCYAVYHYDSRPKTKYIKIRKITTKRIFN